MKKLMSLMSVSAIFAMLLGAAVAHAQPPAGQPPAGEMPTIDEATKEKFLDAYVDIMEIQTRYAELLQGATDESQAMELQQAAQEEMQTAVSDADMTVEEYNEVIQVASANPALMAELEAAIADMME